ncbi:hypothetical protein PF005_g4456 [Phytophthora fragariae]|uniref:Uncharacterized protein n=2 Tax=Phytophthora fragariae TaxID=53985 RepID=A0A6A3TB38_9STRA|nr:hypothetical protein PF009_g4843 [Phytophthora fragariae]KAE9023679.1 hypothetical protein PF011_g3856 [Phytophthora fragariae]KAE9130521.1 hypothetical protein PF007_g4482 [Phytophthora fragariae]KAE9151983.1 hypothetical protein PF006_g3766 [Phytophthora fragariae]KAE9228103.1 hypothetical protein PF005_g4456 [Phytophthora fragariae]
MSGTLVASLSTFATSSRIFPEWFYARKESLEIFKVFKALMEAKLNVVFVGTPGVGKSTLVVLFAFYLALIQKKRVVLFRKQKGKGVSMLYLDAENKRYWRKEEVGISDIELVENRDFELCLDGLAYDDVRDHFGTLARFRMLATSVQYPMKDDDTPVLRRCLVPFWSLSDLRAVGAHVQWTEQQIKDRYFSSGGNLRDFLSEREIVESSIDQTVKSIEPVDAALFNTQYRDPSDRQVDRLRMTGIRANDHRELNKFLYSKHWVYVITSEYALRQLGNIVKPSYYEELWSKGCMLGDDGLMDIAFENYMHTLARNGMKIELRVRAYDRVKARHHTYDSLQFEAKSCRNDGIDATECDAAIKRLASSSDEYWYPSRRSLETIDCVAKLNMGGQPNMVGLIKITKSDTHTVSKAVDKYAGFFPSGSRYVALVPNKETCDKFRFAPASPDTKVPLYVAYITTWCT